jgi:hypothetical protein
VVGGGVTGVLGGVMVTTWLWARWWSSLPKRLRFFGRPPDAYADAANSRIAAIMMARFIYSPVCTQFVQMQISILAHKIWRTFLRSTPFQYR